MHFEERENQSLADSQLGKQDCEKDIPSQSGNSLQRIGKELRDERNMDIAEKGRLINIHMHRRGSTQQKVQERLVQQIFYPGIKDKERKQRKVIPQWHVCWPHSR